jgi:hypothetical protein
LKPSAAAREVLRQSHTVVFLPNAGVRAETGLGGTLTNCEHKFLTGSEESSHFV